MSSHKKKTFKRKQKEVLNRGTSKRQLKPQHRPVMYYILHILYLAVKCLNTVQWGGDKNENQVQKGKIDQTRKLRASFPFFPSIVLFFRLSLVSTGTIWPPRLIIHPSSTLQPTTTVNGKIHENASAARRAHVRPLPRQSYKRWKVTTLHTHFYLSHNTSPPPPCGSRRVGK